MNPGLVVKLRPSGPWRIGPDSGARNRVDFIYHSDSLYSAVASAMARLGSLDAWLDATARKTQGSAPEVCFSSCFPFLDEIGFIVPPRTVWPPVPRALVSARVRWKSARFVPLGVVQAVLSGQRLDDNHWNVDGPSECLVPAGRPGPFRTAVRWSAAVDRMTGAAERHSTACLEFRPGAGLWTIVSFADDAAYTRWLDPVKAAFRLLADTGFGGERSRGWGRSEAPEFIEGNLPDMILPPLEPVAPVTGMPIEEPAAAAPVEVAEGAPAGEAPAEPAKPTEAEAEVRAPQELEPLAALPSQPEEPAKEPQQTESQEVAAAPTEAPTITESEPQPEVEAASSEPPPAAEPETSGTPEPPPALESQPQAAAESEAPAESDSPTPTPQPLTPDLAPPTPASGPHWLLSLFAPSSTDDVDWRRGNYAVLARGGRVESPAGSGELKKQVQMIVEGSVIYAPIGPCGGAPDVAPDGFAHPVFRAGFAVSIPLPEVS